MGFKEVPLNPTTSLQKKRAMKLTWLLVVVFVILQSLQVTEGDPSPAPRRPVGPHIYGGQYCSRWDRACLRRNYPQCRRHCMARFSQGSSYHDRCMRRVCPWVMRAMG